MIDQEKPFKTIEVIDASNGQLCKVACMSCIRGHRTTSCGNPVCRTKVFWTVKRPGRPSNSCTCRYGGSGKCKCVVAKSACPHKPKKGEKRSGECRCDEQGRYCCTIDPEHWKMLLSLQNPTVTFHSSREALEARGQTMAISISPSYSHGSPQHFVTSIPSTPLPTSEIHSPRNVLTPRFGLMGIGAPQGSEHVTPDVLAWQGDSPQVTQAYMEASYNALLANNADHMSSCCQTTELPDSALATIPYLPPATFADAASTAAFARHTPPVGMTDQVPVLPLSGFDTDYFSYQLPNAICQTCGLNGCTCKHCPPMMQNFVTGSWAQFCGRKHARPSAAHTATSNLQPTHTTTIPTVDMYFADSVLEPHPSSALYDHLTQTYDSTRQHTNGLSPQAMTDFNEFDSLSVFGTDLVPTPLESNDLVMDESEDMMNNCCCRKT